MTDLSVIVVDDDELDRYVLKRLLAETALDVHVFEADSGVEAVEFFEDYEANLKKYGPKFPPIVIFLDINMPLMNGQQFLEAFAKMRERLDLGSCVILMYSSSHRQSDREAAQKYDFVGGYLVKGTFVAAELEQRLRTAMAA